LKQLHVGVIGAGQLGRMLALAGYPLGIHCTFLDRSAAAPAAQVAPILIGELEDPAQLAALAAGSDVVTFDWENISGRALAPVEKLTRVRPPRQALEVSQDRLTEKALFSKLRIPVAAHAAVDSKQQLLRAVARLGLPGVLKTRRMGYDGKGQLVVKNAAHVDAAWDAMGGPGLIFEKFQAFSRELSWGPGLRRAKRCSIPYRPMSTKAESCTTASPPTRIDASNEAPTPT
jgi:5-(carboxyamino)imidazole ribonucleotide synthase